MFFFNKNSRKLITITYIYSALNCLGMEVSLVTFLKCTPVLKDVVFPVDAERYILAETVLNVLTYENKDASEENKTTAEFFETYIKETATRRSGRKDCN